MAIKHCAGIRMVPLLLKNRGEVVECPLHFWHYNIRTGELLDYMEGVKLNTFDVEIRKNVFLDI